jgi:hypothetical protein
MKFEGPRVGMVIRHWYLWRNEAEKGQEEGRKLRPCMVAITHQNEHDETEVYIAPITHVPPSDPKIAKEIPAATKARLRLDGERSWIITNELNRFTWRGPDVEETPAGKWTYGYLPANFIKDTIEQIRGHGRERALSVANRDDEMLILRAREHRAKMAERAKGKDTDRDR